MNLSEIWNKVQEHNSFGTNKQHGLAGSTEQSRRHDRQASRWLAAYNAQKYGEGNPEATLQTARDGEKEE